MAIYKYAKEGGALRELRIKAGFPTLKSVCEYTNTPMRTWQNWELGIYLSPNIVDMYLELIIECHRRGF